MRVKKIDDFLNFECNHAPTNNVGGDLKEKCRVEIGIIGKRCVNTPFIGELMGEIVYALKHIKRIGFPMFLNPKKASFAEVAQHAKIRQFLSDSTIIKNIRYAKFMELHPCPVDFRNLTPEQVLKHFDYRIEIENASPHAIAHEKKAIMMFLRAYGLKEEELELWSQVLKTPPIVIKDEVEFVYPQDVHKFYIYEGYSNKKNYEARVYENKLFQHIAFMGFNFGMRCPSEIVTLTLDDVVIKSDGTGYIRVHERKKHGKTRKLIPYNKQVLSSKAYKTPKNYRDNWRPKVANDNSGDAFFLQPNGKPITEKYVRDHLSPAGKKITGNPNFTPYHMRHTFATFFYQYTKNIKKVSKRLGHTKTVNTDKYVAVAEDLEQQFNGKNLFNIALKPYNLEKVSKQNKKMGGKQNKRVTLSYPPKKGSTQSNFSEKEEMGLAGVEPGYKIYLLWVESQNWLNSKSNPFLFKPFFLFLNIMIVVFNSERSTGEKWLWYPS